METFKENNVLTEQFIQTNDKDLNLNFINIKGELKYPSYIKYDELEEDINGLAIAFTEDNIDMKSNFIKEDGTKLFQEDIKDYNISPLINGISLVKKFNGKVNFIDLKGKKIFKKDVESTELENCFYGIHNIEDYILSYPKSQIFIEDKNTIKILNIGGEVEIKTDFIMKEGTRIKKFINNYSVIRNLEGLNNIVSLEGKLLLKEWLKGEVGIIENGIGEVKFYDGSKGYINLKGEITKYKSSL